MGATLHVDVLKGEIDHRRAEVAFQELAIASKRLVGKAGEVIGTRGVI